MIFSSMATVRRQRAVGGILAAALAALCLALLASCGGGTSQVSNFVPQRLLVFGDDMSAITPTGLKYNVNGLNASNLFDCTLEPIWVQSIASAYGLTFAQCNPTDQDTQAIMLAGPGALVTDIAAQVTAQIAAGGFRANDLATVLGGMNDILALYAQYPGRSAASLESEAGARGAQLAQVVNQLINLGVKVIVSDVPDLGLTPYALTQAALDPNNTELAALMSNLTTAFNEQLGVNIILDGRYVGLVQAQLRFQAIGNSPGGFGFNDIVDPICTVPVPLCTSATLVAGATTSGYLWADSTHISTGGHAQLSSLALARIRGNPF